MSAKRLVRLRLARPGDLDALCAIEAAVFSGDRITRRGFRSFIASPSAELIAANLAGHVAGYAVVLFRRGSRVARLYSIAVAPGAAGQGIGKMLLAAAETAARKRGCAVMRLEVDTRNRAVRFYDRAGYEVIGRLADYYEDGGTALRLEKPLFRLSSRKSL